MPYRGLRPTPPDLEAERELHALSRDARRRRARAALSLASLGAGLAVFATQTDRMGPSGTPLCHHVKVVLEQPGGAPPPPMEWTTCRDPHGLTDALERTYHDQAPL